MPDSPPIWFTINTNQSASSIEQEVHERVYRRPGLGHTGLIDDAWDGDDATYLLSSTDWAPNPVLGHAYLGRLEGPDDLGNDRTFVDYMQSWIGISGAADGPQAVVGDLPVGVDPDSVFWDAVLPDEHRLLAILTDTARTHHTPGDVVHLKTNLTVYPDIAPPGWLDQAARAALPDLGTFTDVGEVNGFYVTPPWGLTDAYAWQFSLVDHFTQTRTYPGANVISSLDFSVTYERLYTPVWHYLEDLRRPPLRHTQRGGRGGIGGVPRAVASQTVVDGVARRWNNAIR